MNFPAIIYVTSDGSYHGGFAVYTDLDHVPLVEGEKLTVWKYTKTGSVQLTVEKRTAKHSPEDSHGET